MSELLWHYTSTESVMRIIEGRAFHLSHFRHMNDANEGVECDRVISELYREEWQQYAIGNFTSGLSWYRRDVPVFVLSLSKENDLLSQWRSYGEVALGLEVKSDPKKHIYKLECWYDLYSKVEILNQLGLERYYDTNSRDRYRKEALQYASLVTQRDEGEFKDSNEESLAKVELARLRTILGNKRADYLDEVAWDYCQVEGGGGYREAFGIAAHLNGTAYPIYSFKHEGFEEEKETRLIVERPKEIFYKPSSMGPYPKPYVEVALGLNDDDGMLLSLKELRIGPTVDKSFALKSEGIQNSVSAQLRHSVT